jgi:hypothetical protein
MLRSLFQLTLFSALILLALAWMERRPEATRSGNDRGTLAAHVACSR